MISLQNNQHTVDELAGSVQEMAFWKALDWEGCKGLVQLMDESGSPHSRSWCLLEVIACPY